LTVSLAQDLIVTIDSQSVLRFISISNLMEINHFHLHHPVHFIKFASHNLILIVCIEQEQKQTFIYLFDPECKLIRDIYIDESNIACDIAFTPGHVFYLVFECDPSSIIVFDSFPLKQKSEKYLKNFKLKNFVLINLRYKKTINFI
jgi:hypothetical protein